MQSRHAVDAGIAYAAAMNMQLDLFGGIGITGNAFNYIVGAGICYRIP